MTGIEMVYNFQQLLETISATFHAKERVDTHEILSYLNRTVSRYLKNKYFGGNSFKENTIRLSATIDDLRPLIKITAATGSISLNAVTGFDNDNVETTALPSDFYGYISSSSKISRVTITPEITNKWVPNKEIDYSDMAGVITTPFNKPILESPLVILKNDANVATETGVIDGLMVITDDYTTISDMIITYVTKPVDIDMDGNDCQLADYIHEEIVQLAVAMYVDEYKTRLAREQKINQ